MMLFAIVFILKYYYCCKFKKTIFNYNQNNFMFKNIFYIYLMIKIKNYF